MPSGQSNILIAHASPFRAHSTCVHRLWTLMRKLHSSCSCVWTLKHTSSSRQATRAVTAQRTLVSHCRNCPCPPYTFGQDMPRAANIA